MSDEQPQRPTSPDDPAAWRAYWQAQGMPWRTEPEIDSERQRFLAERRAVKSDIERGIYPFRDENGSIKLTRADVEWLLATHEDGRGPVRWEEEQDNVTEEMRWGLDLRGADLSGVDLSRLRLARLRGGPTNNEWYSTTSKQRELAEAHLEGADLYRARLEGAVLRGAHLERANLNEAHVDAAWLIFVHLEGANLTEAHLEGANLFGAHLEGANLHQAFLDPATILRWITLGDQKHGTVHVADVRWGGVNLAVVDWTPFTDGQALLGDEQAALDWKPKPFIETEEERKHPRQQRARTRAEHDAQQQQVRLQRFQAAVRANRQLATALRDQGMNEEADHFAYRAQVLQRRVFRLQGKRFRAGFSRFLDLLAGYGYAPQRSLVWYVLTVLGFAALYLVFAHLPPQEALILSVTSIHGRGFPGSLSLHDPIMSVAAAEAIFGLLIEISFIATFTQRFFAR